MKSSRTLNPSFTTYGLDIKLNWSAYSEGNLKKLIGQNPRIPYSIRLYYFGAEISDWYPKPHASKFSIKFYDKFIKQSLTQDKLIKEIEKSIGIYKSGNYGFQREIVHILKSINNFETFLNDEMNLLKEKFKDFKKIKKPTWGYLMGTMPDLHSMCQNYTPLLGMYKCFGHEDNPRNLK